MIHLFHDTCINFSHCLIMGHFWPFWLNNKNIRSISRVFLVSLSQCGIFTSILQICAQPLLLMTFENMSNLVRSYTQNTPKVWNNWTVTGVQIFKSYGPIWFFFSFFWKEKKNCDDFFLFWLILKKLWI